MKVLQIATYGEYEEGITLGIKNFPIHKLILICYKEDRRRAEEFGRRISSTLSLPVNYLEVSEYNVIKDTLEKIAQVLKEEEGFE